NAILGSRCWLGFTASGLSPDKKRLALLGAQQYLFVSSGSGLNTSIRKVSALTPGGLVLEFAGFHVA
ncbi:MAG: hypothetical protein ACI9NQ_002037, partial [Paracoccaceae bacterium]